MQTSLADQLAESLDRNGVQYCHWKGNISLARAITGEEDFDLLVERKAWGEVVAMLLRLGFKPAVNMWGQIRPTATHYYGFDPTINLFLHVDLHCQVFSGENFVDSHWFPFERMLLENTSSIGQVKVASKPAELVLFTLKTFIRYGSLLDLIYLAKKLEKIKAELGWLQTNHDTSEALSLLRTYCPVIDEELFLGCIHTLEGQTSLAERVRLALIVRRRLRVYSKFTYLKRLRAYGPVLWARLRRGFVGSGKNKTLLSGGAIIAVVGADATGKSTLVAETGRWLGSFVSTRTVHVGKPASSWLTWPINKCSSLARRLAPGLRHSLLEAQGHPAISESSQKTNNHSSLVYAIRAMTLAWDRYQLLIKVRRAAANGDIVICDRYPTQVIGAMDSPRLEAQPNKNGFKARLYNWLAYLENRLYQCMPPPDVALRLRVSIETAKQRNRARVGSEAEDYLEIRHRESREWHKQGTKYIYDIDTERSLEETVLSVKEAIWKSL